MHATPYSRRQLMRWLAQAGLAGGVGRLWAAGALDAAPGVRQMQGAVQINGQTAQVGQVVRTGDTVTTGVGAQAVYVMGQNAFFLREGSQVQHLHDGVQGVLRVLTGKILSVFGRGAQQIETPTATVGIRGTGCYIEAAPDGVYVCLCYGQADITPLADPGQAQRIETRHHEHPFYVGRGTEGPLMRAADMVNHTDDELILLEALVGREPPFVGQKRPYRY